MQFSQPGIDAALRHQAGMGACSTIRARPSTMMRSAFCIGQPVRDDRGGSVDIEFIDALPMTTTGKVLRRVLKLQGEERFQKTKG